MTNKLRVLSTLLLCMIASVGWGEEVTYTISSKNTLTTAGTAPSGSSASIVETYSTSCQMTASNSQTLTLKGYEGLKITSLVMSMHSNKSGGQAYLSYSLDGGKNFTYIVGSAIGGEAFNTTSWYGSWSTAYVNITKDVLIRPITGDLIIKMGATANSIYCQSYKITYETDNTPSLHDNDLSLLTTALTFDLYNDNNAKIINYTTSSTGAVTVNASDYITTSVDETNKTITVTPTAKTPSVQTITVNQAADNNYEAGSATFNVTIDDSTPDPYKWVETNLADLTSSDVFVIVGNNGSDYAMTNDNGTSAPAAFAVTVANGKITSTVADNIKWTVSGNATDGYIFYPNGNTNNWLYCINNNNGLRVGTGEDKTFVINSDYIYNSGQSRYVGIYTSSDWRSYTTINNNISGQTFHFYKRVDASAPEVPYLSAENYDIAYNATSGEIVYTLSKPATDGVLTASTESGWLTLGTVGETVPFTCTINDAGTSRTATVILTYTYNTTETITKEVTVTQAANPNYAMTIAAVRTQGTGSVVTKGVVTSTYGKNAYIQDANAAIVVRTDGDLTCEVGDEIRVSGTLGTYNGLLQIQNATITTLTTGNAVTPEVMAIANVNESTNQGWLVKIVNAKVTSISGQNVTIAQGENSIEVRFNKATDITFAVNDILTLTGNIGCYNATKQIANPTDVVKKELISVTLTFTDVPQTITKGETTKYLATSEPLVEGITYSSSDENIVSVDSETGYITAVAIGTATITATYAGDSDHKPATASYTIQVVGAPHTATFYMNDEILSEATVNEGNDIVFPTVEQEINGKTFVGWTTVAIDGTTNDKPEVLVTSATMGERDSEYYAVYATKVGGEGGLTTVTDVLTLTTTGVSGTSYTDWSGKTVTSSAVYAGQSAGGNDAIQLRSKSNSSGIVTTTSGGKLTKVVVEWNTGEGATATGRTLDVYGNNTAYTAASDLYATEGNTNQGTKLGSIVCGTSTELEISGDYQYIGLRSNDGAMYLNKISITWQNGTSATYTDYCTTVKTYVAQVGDVKYETFEKAIEALGGDNDVITLLADIEEPYTLTESQSSLNIKHNGFALDVRAPEGYILDVMEDGDVTVYTYNPAVAKIGTASYASLAAAIAAVPADGSETTITMVADDTVEEEGKMTVAAGKNIVLDLNGKTVSGTSGITASFYFITNNGTLEITDNSAEGQGKITYHSTSVESSYSKEFVTIYNLGGTLTMTNGTVENTSGGGLAYAINNSSNAWGSEVISTFNMNGGKISAPQGDATLRVYQNCGASSPNSKNYVNISGGTVDANGIFVDTNLHNQNIPADYAGGNIDTKINISGGAVVGLIDMKTRHPFNTLLNITGGDLSNTKMWVRKVANEYVEACGEPTTPMVTISGGTFAFAGDNTFGLNSNYGATTWTTYEKPYAISGGVFNKAVPAEFCADGMIPADNTDAATSEAYPYTVAQKSYVAQIGDVKYETLEAAFAAAEDGATVTLLKDVELSEGITNGGNAVIDLNGHDITGMVNGKLITNSGTLTIQGSGHIYNKDVTAQGHDAVYNTGTLTIAGGVFGDADDDQTNANGQNRGAAVRNFGGAVTINGGSYTACDNFTNSGYAYALINDNNGSMTINDANVYGKNNGNIANNYGTVTVKGGSFTLNNASSYYSLYVDGEDGVAKTIVEGGTFNNTSNNGLVHTDDANNASIEISGGDFTYTKLTNQTNEALNAAVSGGTFSSPVPAEFCAQGYIPADLGEGKYGVKAGAYVAQVGEQKYETLQAAINAAEAGATVTLLKDVELSEGITNGGNAVIDLNGHDITGMVNGKLITNSGTLTIQGSGHIYNKDVTAQGHDAVYNTGTLTIAGGVFGDADDDQTNANGQNRGAAVRNFGGAVTINGGSYTACDNFTNSGYAYALINDNNGSMTINDANVYGKNNGNIANNYGTVTVKGGSFTLNNASSYYSLYVDGEDGVAKTIVEGGTFNNTSNNGLVHTDDANNASIEISGGDFTYTKLTNQTNEALNAAVSGGTFSSPVPAEFCAQGYIPADLGEGKYGVKAGAYVAQVGEQKYETLQAAVDAATDDANTITLVADINQGNTVVNIDKSVTINGEGHSIASTATQAIGISGSGNVKINNVIITTKNRGINVLDVSSDFTLNVENSTIQTNVDDPTTVYTTGENSRGINIANADGVTVNISNSTIQGFSYDINIPRSGQNLCVNMTGGKTYGRAAVNNWGSNNTITLDGVEVHGLNNETGPTEAFACIVENDGVQNNTFVLKDCQFTGTLSEAAMTAAGSTASEHLLSLRGTNATVKVLGSTTYSCNSDDKSRGGIVATERYLINNNLYFDDTTKQTFADAFVLSIISDEKDAEMDLYPVSFSPEVFFGYVEEGKLKGDYNNFATPFEDGSLITGYYFMAMKDFSLKKNITCTLESGEEFVILLRDYSIDKNGYSVSLPTGVTAYTDKQTDIFSAAEAGYKIVESGSEEEGYSYTAEKVLIAAPTIFHDEGTYEGAIDVAIAGEGTIMYKLGDGEAQTYTAPIAINATTTVTAWTEKDGFKSSEVSKTFTIETKAASAEVAEGYYTIKNNGNGKYVNVAGRKTVTFVDEAATETAAGTVIKVKAEADGVKVLRSQGVDVPGYADKAMRYVPEIVKLVVDKLNNLGEGQLMGEAGLEALMNKFNEAFDEHLYLETVGENSYRIYGRTPSMQHVVDFYAENKQYIDPKLPMLEGLVNKAIEKVLEKTGDRGAGVLVPFSLETVWQNMGGTLTEPVDEASTMKFYEEVLASETNVWDFAYETAMIYWTKLKDNDTFKNNLNKLGDYAKYIDKVENIRPNFKYYIVQKDNKLDIISEGNDEINADFTAWTLTPRTDFSVAFNEDNVLNDKYYTTLYTDFAYTLPTGVKAYKVTEVSEAGVAVKVEMEGTIPAQTPVLLEADAADTKVLTLSTEDGTAPADNILVGADALINQYQIKTAQVEGLFNLAKDILGESFYNTYIQEYEHLMARNAGTVNNKYFFGLTDEDMDLCTYKNENDEDDCVIRNLGTGEDQPLAFYGDWQAPKSNQAFLVSEEFNPVLLKLKGDVYRDGVIDEKDLTALVEIVLEKVTIENKPDNYDFDAAYVNDDEYINIADVTALVNYLKTLQTQTNN